MEDHIDAVTARWRAERPALEIEALGLSDRVVRLARHLELARRDTLAARELEVWEYDVLAALRSAGPGHRLSPSDLMTSTLVASGTVTNRIDRLVRRGFVAREPDPTDRRGVLVRLTPAGRRRIDSAAAELGRAEELAWQALPTRRRDQLTAVLRELLAARDAS